MFENKTWPGKRIRLGDMVSCSRQESSVEAIRSWLSWVDPLLAVVPHAVPMEKVSLGLAAWPRSGEQAAPWTGRGFVRGSSRIDQEMSGLGTMTINEIYMAFVIRV